MKLTLHKHNYQKKLKGFTLIEVLIALAILAISLTAIMKATSSDIEKTQQIRDITAAHYVAMNALSLLELGVINVQDKAHETTLMNKKWRWQSQIAPIKKSALSAVTIKVYYPHRKNYYVLDGYRLDKNTH